ncbi:hypothetical protein XA68_15086 [Ophiocordyceps unilateralis]|uniref:Karyogamy protein n=1 Tax=Ophiocordyceps unilateralis TaxID=268505 RepID=A0A2A9P9C2_OPHUN|nr:hypothetical protein XA68_15086 [Ophiocordyceps unilateralis]
MASVALPADGAASVVFPVSDGQPKQAEAPRTIPVHPISSLQVAFTESLDEVTDGSIAEKPKLALLNAHQRRAELLNQAKDAAPPDALWRYRPGQTQHELFKLLAQIAFGVYLLLDGMANSNSQVIAILQSHIDDVDEYLEVTLQDLAQATADLNARIHHLKMPLSNVAAFEKLLEDRDFRRDILTANEKIDHVLCRTTAAMKQWDDDVAAGLKSTIAFTAWLAEQDDSAWRNRCPDVADVFDAMRGNAEGWLLAFEDIHRRADDVNGLIVRLTTIIAEMEKKAGEVSRRTWARIPPFAPSAPASRARPPSSLRFGVSARQSAHQPPSIREPSPSKTDDARADETTATPPCLADASSDESLYVLQPRIYSPRIPEPPALFARSPQEEGETMTKRGSRAETLGLAEGSPRQRASLGSVLTDASNPPARSVSDTSTPRPSSKYATPRSALVQPLDSAYGTDVDGHSLRRGSASPPPRPHMVHSPCSEQNQFYRPVRASPHSPLQQRPHTATGPPPPLQQAAPPLLRKQPSQPGSMSTLATDDGRSTTPRPPLGGEQQRQQQLKKKKSAFGWFKKAFSLDDEERAQFQARRTMAQPDRYYEAGSPRFLDGRRIR